MIDFSLIKQFVNGLVDSSEFELDTEMTEDNCCVLTDTEGNVIHLTSDEEDGTLVLIGAIGGLPRLDVTEEKPEPTEAEAAENRSDTFRALKFFLGSNLLWNDTDGATFAYVEDGDYIILQRKIPLDDLSQNTFNAALSSFSRELMHWIERYAEVLESDEGGRDMMDSEFVLA
ncbi:MAG: type III secretion system chaperone [Succinivibrio sp.]|nr:type III secretion system chaperone [Succinivibrio sp.]